MFLQLKLFIFAALTVKTQGFMKIACFFFFGGNFLSADFVQNGACKSPVPPGSVKPPPPGSVKAPSWLGEAPPGSLSQAGPPSAPCSPPRLHSGRVPPGLSDPCLQPLPSKVGRWRPGLSDRCLQPLPSTVGVDASSPCSRQWGDTLSNLPVQILNNSSREV